MDINDTIKKILIAGSYAPSGENCQPWRFKVEKNKVLIYNLPDVDSSLYNFEQKASYIAHGAMIENISIAARHFGYNASIELFPNSLGEDITASIEFQESQSQNEPLYEFIAKRATNRKKYEKNPLNDRERDEMLKSQYNDGEIKLIEDREEIRKLSLLTSLGEMIVFENENLHNFMFEHLRWTEREEKEKKNGLFIKTLELNPIQTLAFKLFKKWGRLQKFNRFGVSKLIAKENSEIHFSSGVIGAIIINNTHKGDFLYGGRILQRVWLTAIKLGLSLQPLTGITFLNHHINSGYKEGLSGNHIKIIGNAYKEIMDVFEIGDKQILLLVRIGHSNPPSAYSSRYSLDKLTQWKE